MLLLSFKFLINQQNAEYKNRNRNFHHPIAR